MTKIQLVNNVTRMVHKVGFKVKKHSPEILVTAGVAGTVVGAVMACKATLKVHEVLDTAKNDIDDIHEAMEAGVTKAGAEYTGEDGKKDLSIVYAQTGVKFAKLYGPAVVIGGLSIASILAGHNILRKRNIALAAAYATVDRGFKEYRGRVVERFGEALDRELKYNIKAKEVEEIVVDENGEERVEKKIVETAEINEYSEYARFFDEGCRGWDKDPEYNLMFLRQTQNYANDKLRAKGYLFLNEVYDMLDIPRTQAGQVVGWMLNGDGDGYVDFGIYDVKDERKRAFVNGHERSILLDFNVDGEILHNL